MPACKHAANIREVFIRIPAAAHTPMSILKVSLETFVIEDDIGLESGDWLCGIIRHSRFANLHKPVCRISVIYNSRTTTGSCNLRKYTLFASSGLRINIFEQIRDRPGTQ